MQPRSPVLHIRNLSVAANDGAELLHKVHFELFRGEMLGLVGDTGAGKTTAGLACLAYFRRGVHYISGSLMLNPVDGTEPFELFDLDAETIRSLRGRRIAYVPPNPATALNPALRVSDHLMEIVALHHPGTTDADRRARVAQVLSDVGLPQDNEFQQRWPHELLGDQPQRLGLAMAFVLTPDVVIFDEHTEGMDVVARRRIVETVRHLSLTHNVAGLYLTRDPAVAATIGHRIAVMHHGEIVETTTPEQALTEPEHPITRSLFATMPDTADAELPTTPATQIGSRPGDAEYLLAVEDLSVAYRKHQVLRGITFGVAAGECLFVFGETGSGKTTLAQAIVGLLPRSKGTVRLRGNTLNLRVRRRSPSERHDVQYLFGASAEALNPRRTIGQSLSVPLKTSGSAPVDQHRSLVETTLEAVGLDAAFYDRYPAEVSTEQLHRAAIARALVASPSVLVCDDITAALDAPAQASIIALLSSLRQSHGLAILFLVSDMRWARHVATRIAVLHEGHIIEHGTVDDVVANRTHDYTKALLSNTVGLNPGVPRV